MTAETKSRTPRRRALVTGGARRLGKRLALALARDGYDVAITARRESSDSQTTLGALRDAGSASALFLADFAESGACERLSREVEDGFGPIELLVNNAGVFPNSTLEQADERVFDSTMAVNLRTPYLLTAELGRRMRERGSGCIVNLASVGGLRPYANHLPYSLSKAGLVMLTRASALALAPTVRVNAIAPGTIWIDGEESDSVPKPSPASIPLREFGTAEDIEAALTYLASAKFVTGQVMVVDGGASVRSEHP